MIAHLRLSRPIAWLDIESTGKDVETARVVDLHVILESPATGGEATTREAFSWRVDPGVPIGPEATAVHGITDADVAGLPAFADVAEQVARVVCGEVDFGGFNVVRYDLPLLALELERCGYQLPWETRAVVDAYAVVVRQMSRDLQWCHEYYCGAGFDGAHDAGADALAARRVALAQVSAHWVEPTPAALDAAGRDPDALDRGGKIRLDAEGDPVFAFGKYDGRKLRHYPDYLRWMLMQSFPRDVIAIVQRVLRAGAPGAW